MFFTIVCCFLLNEILRTRCQVIPVDNCRIGRNGEFDIIIKTMEMLETSCNGNQFRLQTELQLVKVRLTEMEERITRIGKFKS